MNLQLQLSAELIDNKLKLTEFCSLSNYLDKEILQTDINSIHYSESSEVNILVRKRVKDSEVINFNIKNRSVYVDNTVYKDYPVFISGPLSDNPPVIDPIGVFTISEHKVTLTSTVDNNKLISNIILIESGRVVPKSNAPQGRSTTGILYVHLKDNRENLIDSYSINTIIGLTWDVYPKRIANYFCVNGVPVRKEIENVEEHVYFTYNSANDIETEIEDSIYEAEVPTDGYHICYHIILPNYNWILNNSELFDLYSTIYFEHEGKIYKYWQETTEFIEIEDLVKLCDANNTYTTLSINNINIFLISNLRRCYINYSLELLNSKLKQCEYDKLKSFNRDLSWMAYNIIQYYIEKEMYSLAEKLFEDLTECNGICSEQNLNKNQLYHGCGCSQRKSHRAF